MEDRSKFSVVRFEDVPVTIHRVDGRPCISGEDIGRCLGMETPRQSVVNLFNRNQDELMAHSSVINLMTEAGTRATRVFTETGCYLVTMFARTRRAKSVRRWLAGLPELARASNEAAVMAAAAAGFSLCRRMARTKKGPGFLETLAACRRGGLTQAETARVLKVSRYMIADYERGLRACGVRFPRVRRRRGAHFIAALAGSAGWQGKGVAP